MHSKASEIIADLKSKDSKVKVRGGEILNIFSLLNIPGKCTSDKEKARISAWRQEKMPIKVNCEQSGRGKATIMRLLAAAREFLNNTVPKHKFGRERRRKTFRLTDNIMKQEIQKKVV